MVLLMTANAKVRHDRDFKLGAVKLVIEEGKTAKEVADDLGVHITTLYGWIKRFKNAQGKPLPGSGRHKPDDELSRLKEENRILRMERDILKKTLPLFMEIRK
jgi:transposase